METKAGARLRSAVCETEFVVVRAASGDVDLRCGGVSVLPIGDARGDGAPAAGFDGGTQLGKRYEHAASGLELLCSKAGAGSLSVGDELLPLKGATPLPSSD